MLYNEGIYKKLTIIIYALAAEQQPHRELPIR